MKNYDINLIINLMSKFSYDSTDKKEEMGEQDAAAGGGGSGSGSKPPYPSVTKWASGRKFGPTYNPEQKVWKSNLTRGKANTLL